MTNVFLQTDKPTLTKETHDLLLGYILNNFPSKNRSIVFVGNLGQTVLKHISCGATRLKSLRDRNSVHHTHSLTVIQTVECQQTFTGLTTDFRTKTRKTSVWFIKQLSSLPCVSL